MITTHTYPFANKLPRELKDDFSRLARETQVAHHHIAEGHVSNIMQNVGPEFQDYQQLHPNIPAMDRLPTAIIAIKLRERGCEVIQRPEKSNGTGWLVRRAG